MQSITMPFTSGSQIADLKGDLLRAIPKLRAYAKNLCRGSERADDLVQEALVKALANIDSFQPGSNMTAWLYVILRNGFYSEYRKRRHEVEDHDGGCAGRLSVRPMQEERLQLLDVQDALGRLPAERREALMLIVSGLSYEEAAAICGCAAGTMKSRVSRARVTLAEILEEGRSRHKAPVRARQVSIPTGAAAFG